MSEGGFGESSSLKSSLGLSSTLPRKVLQLATWHKVKGYNPFYNDDAAQSWRFSKHKAKYCWMMIETATEYLVLAEIIIFPFLDINYFHF